MSHNFDSPQVKEKEEIRRLASSSGADLVGFVSAEHLERIAPASARPSSLADRAKTVIVLAKRTLTGVVWSHHLATKQLAGGHMLRRLDHIAAQLTDALEADGYPSLPVSSGALDFDKRGPEDITPAGQGSHLLRLAAVEAGMGTWGLNLMVLTPQFGPRVYFGGVLTRLALESDARIEEELCLGLEECGRCAAVCPEDAIARRAPIGAPIETYRTLDSAACARSSQPFGFQTFVDHLAEVLKTQDPNEMWSRMRGRKSGEVWSEMAMMKEASMTGCSECIQVCPVGKDYARVQLSEHRKGDLPESIPMKSHDGFVEIEHIGPKVRRKTTWDFETTKQA